MAEDLPSTDSQQCPTRAERKLAQVLEGARAVIVAKGFDGASVDDIARQAGISKATMYRYFPDKTALFQAVMSRDCARQSSAVAEVVDCGKPLSALLQDFGESYLAFILSDFAQDVFRTAVAESERFPEVARTFYETSIDRTRQALLPFMEGAARHGKLPIDDPDLAARRFLALCKGDLPLTQLFGARTAFTPAEISDHVRGAVDAFLKIYRPD